LSKVDKIFNWKPRETKLKLAQARTKNFGWIRSYWIMNVNIEIVFLDFLKNDFLDLRGYDLYGSIMPYNKCMKK